MNEELDPDPYQVDKSPRRLTSEELLSLTENVELYKNTHGNLPIFKLGSYPGVTYIGYVDLAILFRELLNWRTWADHHNCEEILDERNA